MEKMVLIVPEEVDSDDWEAITGTTFDEIAAAAPLKE